MVRLLYSEGTLQVYKHNAKMYANMLDSLPQNVEPLYSGLTITHDAVRGIQALKYLRCLWL